MNWHSLGADAPKQDADKFEADALKKDKLDLSYVPPRYRSSYFSHIWGGGYAAGYYAYLWTQMLADDGFEWFKEHGGLTRENGDRFRAMVVALALVVSRDISGLDEYVESSELTYILILFWLLLAGPGKLSLDTLLARWLGIRTHD